MIDIKDRVKGVADREKWAARGASFAAKAKATKAVWFPPDPAKAGKRAASTTKKATKRTSKKATGAAKKGTGAAKKGTSAATKGTSADKK